MSARTTAVVAAALVLLFGAATEASAQEPLTVVAYNIRHGRGMDGEVDLERIASVLRELDADVIALQEVDDRTERTGGVDQVAVLAELLGYEGFHGPHRPYQGGFYGNAILTRLPVKEFRVHPIPPASGSALSVTEVELERGVSVVSVHLAGSEAERMAQADSLTSWFADAGRPVVLAGDFNDRPDGPVLARLREGWWVIDKGPSGLTYPADAPDREIDFIMVSPAALPVAFDLGVIDEGVASDHRPIRALLRFGLEVHGVPRADRPAELVGEWRVDLRPTPESPAYYVELTISSADEDGLTGTFYDATIEASAVNDDWGDLRFAIVTVDGASRYVTTGVLEGETLSGTTYSPDRDLFSVWTAERR